MFWAESGRSKLVKFGIAQEVASCQRLLIPPSIESSLPTLNANSSEARKTISLGDLAGFSEACDRNLALNGSGHCLEIGLRQAERAIEGCQDWTGADRVHTDTGRDQLAREGAGE